MATERIARAVLELVTDGAKFFADIDKAKKEAGGLARAFESTAKGIKGLGSDTADFGRSLTTGVTAPILAAGAGLLTLAVNSAKAGDAIAKGAREAGLSAQSYQELMFAVGQ